MMKPQNRLPKWWLLALLIPLMAGLLWLDTHLPLSTLGHQMIQAGIVLLIYGVMAYWLWANQSALEHESDQTGAWQRLPLEEGPSPDEPTPSEVEGHDESVFALPLTSPHNPAEDSGILVWLN